MRPLVFLLFFLSFFFSCLFPPLLYYLCNSLEHQVFFVMAFGFQHFGYLVKEHHLTKVLFGRSYMRRCICFHFASLFYGLLHLPTEHNPSNKNACLKDHLFSSSNKNECFFFDQRNSASGSKTPILQRSLQQYYYERTCKPIQDHLLS